MHGLKKVDATTKFGIMRRFFQFKERKFFMCGETHEVLLDV